MAGSLYLIPVLLGETDLNRVLPEHNKQVVATITHFIVEDIRSARRFLRKSNPEMVIDNLKFYELNQHTDRQKIGSYLAPLTEGHHVGIISEAGCPAIADPGADVVTIAQERGFRVVPLVGPSSILLALMGSGFNGQGFNFHGYLPIEAAERTKRIKQLEQGVYTDDQTQLFIETPYRNDKMLEQLLACCRPQTKLCIASNLTTDEEQLCTKTIGEWKKCKPTIGKVPTIFLLYK